MSRSGLGRRVSPDPLAGEADLADHIRLCLAGIKGRLHLVNEVLAGLSGPLVGVLVRPGKSAKSGPAVGVHEHMIPHGLRPYREATG